MKVQSKEDNSLFHQFILAMSINMLTFQPRMLIDVANINW